MAANPTLVACLPVVASVLAEVPALAGVMCCGADRDEAVAKVQALALRVIAERLEHREAPAELLHVTSDAA